MAKDRVTGQRILGVCRMTSDEMEAEGWDEDNIHSNPVVLVLDNGVKLYPSRDEEGNGGGALFGVDGDELFQIV